MGPRERLRNGTKGKTQEWDQGEDSGMGPREKLRNGDQGEDSGMGPREKLRNGTKGKTQEWDQGVKLRNGEGLGLSKSLTSEKPRAQSQNPDPRTHVKR